LVSRILESTLELSYTFRFR